MPQPSPFSDQLNAWLLFTATPALVEQDIFIAAAAPLLAISQLYHQIKFFHWTNQPAFTYLANALPALPDGLTGRQFSRFATHLDNRDE